MTPLKALLISDGRPGHFHLAEGILAAAARRLPLEIETLRVRRPRWLTPGLLWRLSRSRLSPTLVLGYAYNVDATRLPPARLVVSAGGDTLAANIAIARLLDAPNIFYGSLRRYAPEDFALVLTSYARNADKLRHAMTLKPSKLDPGDLPAIAPVGPSRPPRTAGLLVGGDSGTARFLSEDWSRLLVFLEATHAAHGTRWVVSNSPRSPQTFNDSVLRLAARGNGPISKFIDVRTAGTGTLTALFAAAEAVLCTADSSSMVSESVWARRPVLAVSPARMSLPPDEQGYRVYLEQNGWSRSLKIAELSPERALAELGSITPLADNPLDLLAKLLAERLPVMLAKTA